MMKLQNVLVILLLFAVLVVLLGTAYLSLFPRWQYLVFDYDDDVTSEWVSAPFCQGEMSVCRIADHRGLHWYLDSLAGQGYEMIDGGLIVPADLRYSFTFRRRQT